MSRRQRGPDTQGAPELGLCLPNLARLRQRSAQSAPAVREFGVERILLIVEQCDAFAGPRLAHCDALG